jgi:Dyp-type peroxidase family
MRTVLNLANIQGNVAPGFRKGHQAFIFGRFSSGASALRWLHDIVGEVSSAEQVATFNRVFRMVRDALGDGPAADPAELVGSSWLNVMFGYEGLRKMIGEGDLESMPRAFREGMRARAHWLGDDPAEMRDWAVDDDLADPDVVVHIAADDRDLLESRVAHHQAILQLASRVRPRVEWGMALVDAERRPTGKEHFGYRDGISQPDSQRDSQPASQPDSLPHHVPKQDLLDGWPVGDGVAAPGEFILGYPSERPDEDPALPEWATDGSFAVFRKLYQDVAAFRAIGEGRWGSSSALDAAVLGAKLVGRWPSGARLGDETSDPGVDPDSEDDRLRLAPSDLADDDGQRCPLFAHVRKAYPREVEAADPQRHRIIRRGIPYGPPYVPGTAEASAERGLLFLAFQADIGRQFEHIQREWLNSHEYPGRPGEPGADPVVGQPAERRPIDLVRADGTVARFELAKFVTTLGGGYFFVPSIRLLKELAHRQVTGPSGVSKSEEKQEGQVVADHGPGWYGRARAVPTEDEVARFSRVGGSFGGIPVSCLLGQLIIDEIPYSGGHVPPEFNQVTESVRMPPWDDPYSETHPFREQVNDAPLQIAGPFRNRNQANNPVDISNLGSAPPPELEDIQEAMWWEFAGRTRLIAKALRVTVWYQAIRDGVTYWRREHLLIGYEGAGGDS